MPIALNLLGPISIAVQEKHVGAVLWESSQAAHAAAPQRRHQHGIDGEEQGAAGGYPLLHRGGGAGLADDLQAGVVGGGAN